jgi:hypothetical protein
MRLRKEREWELLLAGFGDLWSRKITPAGLGI